MPVEGRGRLNKQRKTWGLTTSLATPSCVQKLQTASNAVRIVREATGKI